MEHPIQINGIQLITGMVSGDNVRLIFKMTFLVWCKFRINQHFEQKISKQFYCFLLTCAPGLFDKSFPIVHNEVFNQVGGETFVSGTIV